MADKSLLGQLAVELDKLTEAQLDECLEEQRMTPAVPLGAVMVRKGYLDFATLLLLLKLQEKRLDERARHSKLRKRDNLFGRVAVDYGFCTQDQMNEVLRIQAQAEREVFVHLGELLIQRGFMKPEDVKLVLEIQDKKILLCRGCRTKFNVAGYRPHQKVTCTRCGAVLEIPGPDAEKEIFAHGTTIHGRPDDRHGARASHATLPARASDGFAPPSAVVTTQSSAPASSAGEARAKVGRYELTGELGRGPQSVVYKAWDREGRRSVAVKLLTVETTAAEVEIFSRAADATRPLDHPNLVKVIEYGEEGRHLFVAAEFVEGATLRARFDEVRANPARIVELWRQMAAGMAHAHAQGVLHRDLKPENVLLDATGVVRIADFGIAIRMGSAADEDAAGDRLIAGTAPYLSPEQARGESSKLTPAADVYALGAIAYELFAGRPPHVAETLPALLDKINLAAAPPLRPLRPEIAPAVEAIVMKCLRREPHRRYPDAGALLADLERWTRGEPVQAEEERREGLFARLRRWLFR